jgi:putative addiction module CopG family antidote
MSITLTPEQEGMIQVLLETGKFNNIDEVIETALRVLVEEHCPVKYVGKVLVVKAAQNTVDYDGVINNLREERINQFIPE